MCILFVLNWTIFWQSQNSTSAVYMTELEKLENYWITERESVSPLSQDNAKQIERVYCM